jgi:hypothetical protein
MGTTSSYVPSGEEQRDNERPANKLNTFGTSLHYDLYSQKLSEMSLWSLFSERDCGSCAGWSKFDNNAFGLPSLSSVTVTKRCSTIHYIAEYRGLWGQWSIRSEDTRHRWRTKLHPPSRLFVSIYDLSTVVTMRAPQVT